MNEQFDIVNLLKDKKALIKMGRGEEALKAMFDAKFKQ